jgi:hypothetical protein
MLYTGIFLVNHGPVFTRNRQTPIDPAKQNIPDNTIKYQHPHPNDSRGIICPLYRLQNPVIHELIVPCLKARPGWSHLFDGDPHSWSKLCIFWTAYCSSCASNLLGHQSTRQTTLHCLQAQLCAGSSQLIQLAPMTERQTLRTLRKQSTICIRHTGQGVQEGNSQSCAFCRGSGPKSRETPELFASSGSNVHM